MFVLHLSPSLKRCRVSKMDTFTFTSLSRHQGVMPCSLVQDSGFFNNIIFLDVEGLGFFWPLAQICLFI